MKYVRIAGDNGPRWGVLEGAQVRTLDAAPYAGGQADGGSLPLEGCRLLAPCQPGKIVCVGKNYMDHALEMQEGIPETPILFLKGPNCVNHPDGEIRAPAFVRRVDYEGELALVIARRAKDISPQEALSYVLGYTCLNDVTAREVQKADGQWTRGKCMDGFAPIGPWITDEVDPAGLTVETRLNGRVVQRGSTADFLWKLPELLAFITASMTLEPGDVVTTGTPSGIGPMEAGDVVEVEIAGIGTLRSRRV